MRPQSQIRSKVLRKNVIAIDVTSAAFVCNFSVVFGNNDETATFFTTVGFFDFCDVFSLLSIRLNF